MDEEYFQRYILRGTCYVAEVCGVVVIASSLPPTNASDSLAAIGGMAAYLVGKFFENRPVELGNLEKKLEAPINEEG